jgi:hypothetical protein
MLASLLSLVILDPPILALAYETRPDKAQTGSLRPDQERRGGARLALRAFVVHGG